MFFFGAHSETLIELSLSTFHSIDSATPRNSFDTPETTPLCPFSNHQFRNTFWCLATPTPICLLPFQVSSAALSCSFSSFPLRTVVVDVVPPSPRRLPAIAIQFPLHEIFDPLQFVSSLSFEQVDLKEY
jgi:hypothetical protein